MSDIEDSEEPNGYLAEVLSLLRLTYPHEARQLELGIANVRAAADRAEVAALDLRAALVSMTLDLRRDKSADEHIAATVGSGARVESCRRFLAVANGAADTQLSDLDSFFSSALLDSAEWSEFHDGQLLCLRQAVRLADASARERP